MATGPIIHPSPVRRWVVLGVLGFGALLGVAAGAEAVLGQDDPTCGYTAYRNALAKAGYGWFDFPFDDVRCADGFGFGRAISTTGPDLDALFVYEHGRWNVYGTNVPGRAIPNDFPDEVLVQILPPGRPR